MTDTSSPLVVPVSVDAWVLNPQTAHSDPRTAYSIRGSMAYSNLADFGDPSPAPFRPTTRTSSTRPRTTGRT